MEFSGCSLLHTTVSRAAGGATIPGRVVYRLSPVCQHPCQFAVTGGGHSCVSLHCLFTSLSFASGGVNYITLLFCIKQYFLKETRADGRTGAQPVSCLLSTSA